MTFGSEPERAGVPDEQRAARQYVLERPHPFDDAPGREQEPTIRERHGCGRIHRFEPAPLKRAGNGGEAAPIDVRDQDPREDLAERERFVQDLARRKQQRGSTVADLPIAKRLVKAVLLGRVYEVRPATGKPDMEWNVLKGALHGGHVGQVLELTDGRNDLARHDATPAASA